MATPTTSPATGQNPTPADTKTAHTPGPWHTERGPEGLWLKVTNIELEQAVCRLPTRPWSGGAESREADARLIAAAPVLLAELERDLAYVREMKRALRVVGWRDTVQYTATEMRERSILAALARASEGVGR